MKVMNDHRSKFSNLSNWKEEAWKSGLQWDSNPWPPRYRCVALPTELWSHTLGARSIYWAHISREEWNDVKYMKSSIWSEVTGSNPVEALIFFRLLLSNCLNWKIYCDDRSSLSLLRLERKQKRPILNSHTASPSFFILIWNWNDKYVHTFP